MVGTDRAGHRRLQGDGGDAVTKLDRLPQRGQGGDAGVGTKKALLPVYLEPADVSAKLQYHLAGIQHLQLYGENEEQVLEDLPNGLAKRCISRLGESVALQSTTVKRHDRPRPNLLPPPNRITWPS